MTFPIIIHKVEVNKKFVVAFVCGDCGLLVARYQHAVIKHHSLP